MFFQTWCLGVEMTYGIETPFRVEMRGACFGFFPASFFYKKTKKRYPHFPYTQKNVSQKLPIGAPKTQLACFLCLFCYC